MENPESQYEEMDSPQLYFEDLDEDSELWLVRMPHDAEVSELDNKKFKIDGEIHSLSTESGKQYDCVAHVLKEPNMFLVLPKNNSNQLSCVRRTFKGTIFVSEVITSQSKPEVKTEQSGSNGLNSSMEVDDPERSHKKHKKKNKTNGFKEEPSSDLDGFPLCTSQIS